jgi:hypothetical protein
MKLHLGIGHYGIGFKDGVNTVISRNVRALKEIDPEMRITLFGKLALDYKDFIKPVPEKLEYLNINEFNPEAERGRIREKSIIEQHVHDYVWQGTNIAEILVEKLRGMDVVMTENLGIGIDPSVTYAFYLYTQYCHTSREQNKFIYRFHDFVQQRPVNFKNVKKFYESRFGIMPHWHSVLYPAFPNIKYISINRYDRARLFEHGIEESNVYYIPNSVDKAIIPPDSRGEELRRKIIQREKLDPDVRFIMYPVRCVRRKNVEEAIFLTKFFNTISGRKTEIRNHRLKGKFHLLVSIRPTSGDDAKYTDHLIEFVKKHNLPVTIGIDDLVSIEREVDTADPDKIIKYSIGDLYMASEIVITTSILEGFGFVYVEPWILDRAVIGRSIPLITPDFQAAGMKLGYLYNALIIDRHDFKDIGMDEPDPDKALEKRLAKIPKLNDPKVVDKFIESNETSITATINLFDRDRREKIIKRNKEVVDEVYSKEAVGKRLYDVIIGA